MEKQPLDKTISIFGCGWLGLPLGIKLKSEGYSIIGTTTSTEKIPVLQSSGIKPVIFNLERQSENNSLFDAETAIICIPSKNVEGFSDLAKKIRKSNISNVLFISSTSVYKANSGNIFEDAELNQGQLASIEKEFTGTMDGRATILRFSGLIGPGRHPGRFFRDKPVPNPNGVVNMIHLDDCIAIISSILQKNEWGEVFHAASDSHPSRREFYSKAREAMQLNVPLFGGSENSDPGKIIVSKKLKEHLEYEFIHSDIVEALEHCTA
jgi:nucleoside-diphosphate-sugar epimerase